MQDERKVALYIRLSMEDKDLRLNDRKSESDSILHQKTMLKDYVKSKKEFSGMDVLEFKDDGYSGTNFERPMFQKLMSEVRKGTIAVIIVKDFSRLGRDYLDSGNYLDRIFPAYGVRFIAINDHYDSDSHIGRTTDIDVSLKNIINDLYCKDLSLKSKSAFRVRMKRGEHFTAYAFYGYKKNPNDRYRIIIDEPAANIVRRIFDYSIQGVSTYSIARLLNEENVSSPSEYKREQGLYDKGRGINGHSTWNGSTVKRIIQDERYTGKMISHKRESSDIHLKLVTSVPKEEWIVVDGTHEAIISSKIYKKANEALAARIKTPGKKGKLERRNMFTCRHCGHKLQFSGGKDNRRYLFCGHSAVTGNENCLKIHFETEKIENLVVAILNKMGEVFLEKKKIKNTNQVESLKIKADIKSCNNKLESLKQSRRKDYLLLKDGRLRKEVFLSRKQKLTEEANAIEETIKKLEIQLEDSLDRNNDREEIVSVVNEYFLIKQFDRDILRKVINAIYIDAKGNVELEFCKQDIFQEIISKHEETIKDYASCTN